jgi:pyruvate/2-oxoglutarate dehydrogenase complex dihydrolipoamide dehydrogenase (E3) component
VACLPSKIEIWGDRVARLSQNAAHFGTLTDRIHIDMAKVWHRNQEMVECGISLHSNAYKESGAELMMGTGRFVDLSQESEGILLNDGGGRLLLDEQIVVNVG